jgi:hypothetical protein
LVLRASHLSSESARLGLASGFGRMAARHGVGSCGTIFHLGGVGRSAGRAACATLRCTRATGMAMVDGRRRTETTRAQSQQKRRQVRGDGAERQRWDEMIPGSMRQQKYIGPNPSGMPGARRSNPRVLERANRSRCPNWRILSLTSCVGVPSRILDFREFFKML